MNATLEGARVAQLADGRLVAAWSRQAVADRLADAARTLKALPAAGCFPGGLAARWPEIVRGFWEVWNALDGGPARRRYAEARNRDQSQARPRPSAAAIDAMDEALTWLAWVPDRRHVRATWALALGLRPGRVAQELGVSRQTLATWHRASLEAIVQQLNRQPQTE